MTKNNVKLINVLISMSKHYRSEQLQTSCSRYSVSN